MARPTELDPQTLALVALAAAVAQGDERELGESMESARRLQVPVAWVEELLLQSVLMVGYPRALIAFGVWRALGLVPAPDADPGINYDRAMEWTRIGEETCRIVYRENYQKLRANVRALHPALDAWMVTEGYGRTLSRPGLDLLRRELCTVVQMAVVDAPRQLHSHLRGALNSGASTGQIEAMLSILSPRLTIPLRERVHALWQTVRASWTPEPS